MAVLQGGGQNLPSPCVCYPKYPMWNKVKFDLNIKKSIGLFHKLITPIVLYGCEIWSTFSQHHVNTMSTNPHIFWHYSTSTL